MRIVSGDTAPSLRYREAVEHAPASEYPERKDSAIAMLAYVARRMRFSTDEDKWGPLPVRGGRRWGPIGPLRLLREDMQPILAVPRRPLRGRRHPGAVQRNYDKPNQTIQQ